MMELSKANFKNASVLALIVQQIALILLIRYSRTAFAVRAYASIIVLCSECLKLLLNLALELYTNKNRQQLKTLLKNLVGKESFKLLIPALFYVIQNNLLFVALTNLPVPIYQVMIQGKLLTTALFSKYMLHTRLSAYQYMSLFLLAGGVAVAQLAGNNSEHDNDDAAKQNHLIGMVAVIASCLTSGFAGVYFEKVLKRKEISHEPHSVYERNMQLAFWSIGFGTIAIFISGDWDTMQSGGGAFRGFNGIVLTVTVFQAMTGLLIALVIEYADNIVKGYATSVALVIATMLSIFFGDMRMSPSFLFGAFLVLVAVDMFTSNAWKETDVINAKPSGMSNELSSKRRYGIYLLIWILFSVNFAVSVNNEKSTDDNAYTEKSMGDNAYIEMSTDDYSDLYGMVPEEFRKIKATWPVGMEYTKYIMKKMGLMRTNEEWKKRKEKKNAKCGEPLDVLIFMMQEVQKREGNMILAYGGLIHTYREKAIMKPKGGYFDDDIDNYVDAAGLQTIVNLEPVLWQRFGWTVRLFYPDDDRHATFGQVLNPCFHNLTQEGGKITGESIAIEMYPLEPQPDGTIKELWSGYSYPKSWLYPGRLSEPMKAFGHDKLVNLTVPAEPEKILTCIYGDWHVVRTRPLGLQKWLSDFFSNVFAKISNVFAKTAPNKVAEWNICKDK